MNTSINLHYSIEKQICEISFDTGISKSEVVMVLISKIRNFKSMQKIQGVLMEYQDRIERYDNSGEKISAYKRVHFCPDSDMVQFAKVLRFDYGISLSKLVAASFLFFWEDILKEIYGSEECLKEILNNYEKIKKYFKKLIQYFVERLNFEQKNPIQRE